MTTQNPTNTCQKLQRTMIRWGSIQTVSKAFGEPVLQAEDDGQIRPLHQRASKPDDSARRETVRSRRGSGGGIDRQVAASIVPQQSQRFDH